MKYDIMAFFLSSLVILVYYLYLGRRTRRAPNSSLHTLNASVRERWVKMIMSSGKMEVLAIQTLRNSVMAANFIASTSILLIIGTLNISEKIGKWTLQWRPFGLTQTLSTELWQLKLCILLLDLISLQFLDWPIDKQFPHKTENLPNL